MRPEALDDKLYLWWLTDPQHPRWIGVSAADIESLSQTIRSSQTL
jgi:hypothetical protein